MTYDTGVEIINSCDAEILIAQIEKAMALLSVCYDDMSPDARAASLELAHSLAELRKKLVRDVSKAG